MLALQASLVLFRILGQSIQEVIELIECKVWQSIAAIEMDSLDLFQYKTSFCHNNYVLKLVLNAETHDSFNGALSFPEWGRFTLHNFVPNLNTYCMRTLHSSAYIQCCLLDMSYVISIVFSFVSLLFSRVPGYI